MRILAFLAILAVTPALAAEPAKTAVFDIELIDMSQEAERGIREQPLNWLCGLGRVLRFHGLEQGDQLCAAFLAFGDIAAGHFQRCFWLYHQPVPLLEARTTASRPAK